MQEILIIIAATIVIAHNEWRYRRLQKSVDVVGTIVGEIADMLCDESDESIAKRVDALWLDRELKEAEGEYYID